MNTQEIVEALTGMTSIFDSPLQAREQIERNNALIAEMNKQIEQLEQLIAREYASDDTDNLVIELAEQRSQKLVAVQEKVELYSNKLREHFNLS